MVNESKKPHAVDKYVGTRLRDRRTILGLSQEEIGDSVGITFQQIQKYERGKDRIAASRLYEFSQLLGCSIAYFFDGLEIWAENQPEYAEYYEKNLKEAANKNNVSAEGKMLFMHEDIFNTGITQKETLALVRAYHNLPAGKIRKSVYGLITTLGKSSKKKCENASNSNKIE